MDTRSQDVPAPRLIDPGEHGWAPEPKTSQPEALLYGQFAGAVRLLGVAAAAASDAYSLICKHAAEGETTFVQQEDRNKWREDTQPLVEQAWALIEQTGDVFRAVAYLTAEMQRRMIERMHESMKEAEAKVADAPTAEAAEPQCHPQPTSTASGGRTTAITSSGDL